MKPAILLAAILIASYWWRSQWRKPIIADPAWHDDHGLLAVDPYLDSLHDEYAAWTRWSEQENAILTEDRSQRIWRRIVNEIGAA